VPIIDDFHARCAGNSDIVGHLPYLHERALKASTMIELGVRSGESSCAFLAAGVKTGGRLFSVDIEPPGVPAHWWDGTGWTFILGNDLEVGAQLPKVCDLLFIDTSHTYRQTSDELALYGPRVAPGGVILLHDTDLEVAPGSVAEEDRGFPVRRAVQDWCKTQGLTPTFREGWHGLGVIEVDNDG
jgi:predicted O-methyltransferase YrrM